ncbi:MAG: MATE family efflux transporter, partial [Anaerotignaceae bacterium]
MLSSLILIKREGDWLRAKAMTEGNIFKQILFFTLPLLLGNLFQQLYNTVDVIVVGNYVGKDALAAVGASTPVISILVGFFVGISTGASVVIAQFFGAQDKKRVNEAVHSSFFVTIILGILFTIIGVLASPIILKMMKTPDSVLDDGVVYLRIYFLGQLPLLVYNMGAAVLRAVGDSRRPLYFLIFSSITNIVLDIVFVVVFKMGIAGVAWATVIAQTLSAVLVVVVLIKSDDIYRLILKDIKLHISMLRRIVVVGLPNGIQQSVTGFSNVMVQTYINTFGSVAIAGFGVYLKVDNLLLLCTQSISLAIITFVGQNIGAGNMKRAKEGTRVAFLMGFFTNIILCALVVGFGRWILGIFTPDADIIEYGYKTVQILMPL